MNKNQPDFPAEAVLGLNFGPEDPSDLPDFPTPPEVGETPLPAVVPAQPETSRKPGKLRKLTAAVGLVVVGVAAAKGGVNMYHKMTDNRVSFNADGSYDLPEIAKIPASSLPGEFGRVDNDLRKALSVDTCETKVTPEAAFSMYLRLFGPESAPRDDPDGLRLQADAAIERTHEAASHLTFSPFPTDQYKKLKQDAFSENPQLPLEEYQQTLGSYLAPLGLSVGHEWQASDSDAPDDELIVPIDPVANESDIMARRAIVGAIGGYAFMPKELVERGIL